MVESNENFFLSNKGYIIGLVIAFLVGLIPMWIYASSNASQRDSAIRRLNECRLKDRVAAAGMFAKRGEYETARREASTFFSDLRQIVDQDKSFPDQERADLRLLLQQRDDIITLLARSDPAGVDRVFALEYQLRQKLPTE